MLRWCWKLHYKNHHKLIDFAQQPRQIMELPSANWDSDAFFRRYTQLLRRFGAGASCVAFLVISTILKILRTVHSFAVLWFFNSILKVWMQKMQDASARQILGNSLQILCEVRLKFITWKSPKKHIAHRRIFLVRLWRIGAHGAYCANSLDQMEIHLPNEISSGVKTAVTSTQLGTLPTSVEEASERFYTNGTLFTWFVFDASIKLSS